MLLLAKQFFSLIGTPLQIYSKVAAYSEANSFNEEFTWVIAKWLFLSADLLGGRLFVPSAFLTLQAPWLLCQQGRQVFAQAYEI